MPTNVIVNANVTLAVSDIPRAQNEWYVVSSLAYRPDKDQFIEDRFRSDFPNISLPVTEPVKRIYSLCSRSSSLGEWLARINLAYASQESVPNYFRDVISTGAFNETKENITTINEAARVRAAAEKAASDAYKLALDNARQAYEASIASAIGNNNVKILCLNTTALPLTLLNMVENYTPANAQAPNQKQYAAEVLIRYKKSLFELLRRQPGIDLAAVIEEAKTK